MIALNDNINKNLINLIYNFSSINNKYWLSKRDIERIIETKTSTDYNKVEILLKIYNDFYYSQHSIEDIFNTSYIKNYYEYKNKIDVKYGKNNNDSFIDRFLTFATIKNIYNKIIENISKNVLVKDKNISILIIILILIILIFLFSNKFFDNDNSSIEVNKIEKIINN